MSVIVELTLPAGNFELGRILDVEGSTSVVLETLVPLSERSVPFFRLHDDGRSQFERAVRNHPAVNDITVVSSHDDETLYALDWESSQDSLFLGIQETRGTLLQASGSADRWAFELRFPSHAALSTFQEYCREVDMGVTVSRVYNPTKPDAGPWYGLTPRQRETLIRAVEAGYYAIPRETSTKDLAREYGISDQAVTERLRRAISTLVGNTLDVPEED